ncbi:MAG: hypothetical protein WC848_02545 [Parcubacteria group bacterium]
MKDLALAVLSLIMNILAEKSQSGKSRKTILFKESAKIPHLIIPIWKNWIYLEEDKTCFNLKEIF